MMVGIGIIGIVVGVLSLGYTVLGVMQNKKVAKLIVAEKESVSARLLDIRRRFVGYQKTILNDRQAFNDPTRNTIAVRIEEIDTLVENLKRFAEQLHRTGDSNKP